MESAKRKPGAQPKFSKDDDTLLYNYVKEFGEDYWIKAANFIPSKTPKQCKDRWFCYINPNLNNAPWTDEEDEEIMRLFKLIGSKWSVMSKSQTLSSRLPNKIRFRFLKLQRLDRSKARFSVKSRSKKRPRGESKGLNDNINLLERFPAMCEPKVRIEPDNNLNQLPERHEEIEQSEDLIDRVFKSVLCDMNIDDFLYMKG